MLTSVSFFTSTPRPAPPRSAEESNTSAAARNLGHLRQAIDDSKDLKDEVLDPLKTPANLAGRGAEGLGLAGCAVGGAHGIKTVIEGLREGDTPRVVSGATEVTTTAGTLATLGVIGGAAVLAPLGAGLLVTRGAYNVEKAKDIDKRIDGVSDLISATAISSTLLHAPLGVTITLGLAAGTWSAMQGLHRIHQGEENGDARLQIRGTGQLLASAGLVGVASGLAVVPGVTLVVAGASLGLLERVPTFRPVIDKMVQVAAPALAPLGASSEKGVSRTLEAIRPAISTVSSAARRAHEFASPVLSPVEGAVSRLHQAMAPQVAAALDHVSDWQVFHVADRAVGAVRDFLLPEPAPSAAPAPAQSPTPAAPPAIAQVDAPAAPPATPLSASPADAPARAQADAPAAPPATPLSASPADAPAGAPVDAPARAQATTAAPHPPTESR